MFSFWSFAFPFFSKKVHLGVSRYPTPYAYLYTYIVLTYFIYKINHQLNQSFLLLLYIFITVSNEECNFLLNFIEKVQNIYNSKSSLHDTELDKILFRFECTKEESTHIANVLQCYNFDLDLALHAQKNSQVFYGMEFCPIKELAMIFNSHPLCTFTYSILPSGASYPLHHIPPEIRTDDIKYHKECGNHKSALNFPKHNDSKVCDT